MSVAVQKAHPLVVRRLPPIEYFAAMELQRSIWAEVVEGQAASHLLLLEHPHVVTMGIRGGQNNLNIGLQELGERGVAFVETDRGGDITYHGPGQLVCYPVLDLRLVGKDVVGYVRALEEVILLTCRDLGVEEVDRKEGFPGVWVGDDKVAAIGVRVKGRVSFHGLALNVDTDLSYFDLMVPCGLSGKGVTSLSQRLDRRVDRAEVEPIFIDRFCQVMGVRVISGLDLPNGADPLHHPAKGPAGDPVLAGTP